MIPTAPFPSPAVQATQAPTTAPAALDAAIPLWSRESDKLFLKALAVYDQDSSTRWENVASIVARKDVEELKRYYELLLQDVNRHCELLLQNVSRHYELLLQEVTPSDAGMIVSLSYNTSAAEVSAMDTNMVAPRSYNTLGAEMSPIDTNMVAPPSYNTSATEVTAIGAGRVAPLSYNTVVLPMFEGDGDQYPSGFELARDHWDGSTQATPNGPSMGANGEFEGAGHQLDSLARQSLGANGGHNGGFGAGDQCLTGPSTPVIPNGANVGVATELQGGPHQCEGSAGESPGITPPTANSEINGAFQGAGCEWNFSAGQSPGANRGFNGGFGRDQSNSWAGQSPPVIPNGATMSVNSGLQGAGDQWDGSPRVNPNGTNGSNWGVGNQVDSSASQFPGITQNGANWGMNGAFEGAGDGGDFSAGRSLRVTHNRANVGHDDAFGAEDQWKSSGGQSPLVIPNAANMGVTSGLQGGGLQLDSRVGYSPPVIPNGANTGINTVLPRAGHQSDFSTGHSLGVNRGFTVGFGARDLLDSLARQCSPVIPNGINSGLEGAGDQWDNSHRINPNGPSWGVNVGLGIGNQGGSSTRQSPRITRRNGANLGINSALEGAGHHSDFSSGQSSRVTPNRANVGLGGEFEAGDQWNSSGGQFPGVIPNATNMGVTGGLQGGVHQFDSPAGYSPPVIPNGARAGINPVLSGTEHRWDFLGGKSPGVNKSFNVGFEAGDQSNSSVGQSPPVIPNGVNSGQSPGIIPNAANMGITSGLQGGHQSDSPVGFVPPVIPYGANPDVNGGLGGKYSSSQRWSKGKPWTVEEHKLFLSGLDKFGKGDWRSISRHYVHSRTSTQISSHAQKYFIRLKSINKNKSRFSIHDITSVNGVGGHDLQGNPAPITGKSSSTMPTASQPALQGNPVLSLGNLLYNVNYKSISCPC